MHTPYCYVLIIVLQTAFLKHVSCPVHTITSSLLLGCSPSLIRSTNASVLCTQHILIPSPCLCLFFFDLQTCEISPQQSPVLLIPELFIAASNIKQPTTDVCTTQDKGKNKNRQMNFDKLTYYCVNVTE